MPEPVPGLCALLPGVLRLGTPAAPAPAGMVAPCRPSELAVGAVQGHPSNVVSVPYRVDGGALQVAHAVPTNAQAPDGAQPFVAHLPPLAPGQRLDYRAELRRVGQLIGVAPADGSWKSITAHTGPGARPGPAPAPLPSNDTSGKPRFAFDLEFLGALTVTLRAEVLGHTPQGFRINFFIVQGELRGPRLQGRVRPEGGDWMCIRPDGVGEVDIKVTYEMSDGALILEQSGGVFDIGRDGYAKVIRGVYEGAPPFFATPVYITADPRWQWINRLQCLGFGRVVMNDLRVECDVYTPHLKSGPLN